MNGYMCIFHSVKKEIICIANVGSGNRLKIHLSSLGFLLASFPHSFHEQTHTPNSQHGTKEIRKIEEEKNAERNPFGVINSMMASWFALAYDLSESLNDDSAWPLFG